MPIHTPNLPHARMSEQFWVPCGTRTGAGTGAGSGTGAGVGTGTGTGTE